MQPQDLPRPLWRIWFLLALSPCFCLLFPTASFADSASDLANRVSLFVKELQDAAKNEAANSKPAEAGGSGAKYEEQNRKENLNRLVLQLRTLGSSLQRGEYEGLDRSLTSGQLTYVPESLQQKWSDLAATLQSEVPKLAEAAQLAWYREIDELVAETRKGCLAAENSGQLDPLFIRATAAQLKRPPRQDALSQRGGEKLTGIVFTLQKWAHYLDNTAAGNNRAANAALKSFREQGMFPILTAEDLKSRQQSNDETSAVERGKKLIQEIKELAELEQAIVRWKELLSKNQEDTTGFGKAELTKLETLNRAYTAFKNGDGDGAYEILKSATTYDAGSVELNPLFSDLRTKLLMPVLAFQIQKATGLVLGDKPPLIFLEESIEKAGTEKNYELLLKLYDLRGQMDLINKRQSDTPRESIRRFLAAKRFEAAKDAVMAVAEYRAVVAAAPGRFSPQHEAQEALLRLQESNPEAFKDNDATVLKELRMLRDMMQRGRHPY